MESGKALSDSEMSKLGEDGELTAFGDLLNHLWVEALQQSLGLLDGAVAHDLQQDSFLVLQRQRCQGPQFSIFVYGVNRECFHDSSLSLPPAQASREISPFSFGSFPIPPLRDKGKCTVN